MCEKRLLTKTSLDSINNVNLYCGNDLKIAFQSSLQTLPCRMKNCSNSVIRELEELVKFAQSNEITRTMKSLLLFHCMLWIKHCVNSRLWACYSPQDWELTFFQSLSIVASKHQGFSRMGLKVNFVFLAV